MRSIFLAVGVDLDGAMVAAWDVGPYCFAEITDFWSGVKGFGFCGDDDDDVRVWGGCKDGI